MRLGRLWAFMLAGLVGWAQPLEMPLAGTEQEALLQRRAELQRQKESLLAIGHAELENRKKATEYYRDHRWLQTDLPLPDFVGQWMALVDVESVRRVDDTVLRAYPDSPSQLQYYEVRGRIIKVWELEWSNHFTETERVSVNTGMTLSLLWTGIQQTSEGVSFLPCIWEPKKVYLVYDLSPAPKTGVSEPVTSLQGGFPSEPRVGSVLDNFWWIPYIDNNSYCLSGSHKNVLRWASCSTNLVKGEVTSRIESPPAEVLQVLDEEAEFLRLPSRREVQLNWVKQRVWNDHLPLWKRQRALRYWFLADNAQKEFPVEQHGELYVRQQVEYLAFLQTLKEPELQGYGLRTMWKAIGGMGYKAAVELVEQWFQALMPFLATERDPAVRREAAAVLFECLVRPGVFEWLSTDREWALTRARWLQKQSEEESDPIVRFTLNEASRLIVLTDIDRQLDAIEKRMEKR